jgi:hypothetical protein
LLEMVIHETSLDAKTGQCQGNYNHQVFEGQIAVNKLSGLCHIMLVFIEIFSVDLNIYPNCLVNSVSLSNFQLTFLGVEHANLLVLER